MSRSISECVTRPTCSATRSIPTRRAHVAIARISLDRRWSNTFSGRANTPIPYRGKASLATAHISVASAQRPREHCDQNGASHGGCSAERDRPALRRFERLSARAPSRDLSMTEASPCVHQDARADDGHADHWGAGGRTNGCRVGSRGREFPKKHSKARNDEAESHQGKSGSNPREEGTFRGENHARVDVQLVRHAYA